jgi:NAD(P)H-hydrate epimerase
MAQTQMHKTTPFPDLWLPRQVIREIDAVAVRELEIPSLLLMENAARGVCDRLLALLPEHQKHAVNIVVLCGPGNNGGDGLCVARLLAANGLTPDVRLVTAGKPLSQDAAANLKYLQNAGYPVTQGRTEDLVMRLSEAGSDDWIIDALLGTGMTGNPRREFAEVIDAANSSRASILAVDLPSGLDCDTGTASGSCIRAKQTVTFVAQKSGFRNPAATEYTGEVQVCHIGIPLHWLQSWYDDLHRDSENR